MQWRQRMEFAWRQTADGNEGLAVFLSRLSIFGLVLAVAVLVAVLSVMNGFEREMRHRILGLVPHVSVRGYGALEAWQEQAATYADLEGVETAALFAERDVLLMRGNRVQAGRWLGVTAATYETWRDLVTTSADPTGVNLGAGDIVVGRALAARLEVKPGDSLRLILPGAEEGGRNSQPDLVTATVVGLANTGTELDEGLLLGSFEHVLSLPGGDAGSIGLGLQMKALFDAPLLRRQLSQMLPPTQYATDWTTTQGNLYAAIQLSRDLISLLLLSFIGVAAFNVVSSLVLVVLGRRNAIAMLRALGANRRDIVWIYLLQGSLIGVIGASVGVALGVLLAHAAPGLAALLEGALGTPLLSTDVYPLSFLPVDVRNLDLLAVWIAAVALCLLAAILPARRASGLAVADILAAHSR